MAGLTWRVQLRGGWRALTAFGTPTGLRFGASPNPPGVVSFGTGAGAGQADTLYRNAFTLAPSASLAIDLKGGTGELDVTGAALTLQLVRALYVEFTTAPAAGVSVRLGPQGATNAWQGPFGGVAAANYLTLQQGVLVPAPVDGWAVDATHKILTLTNPGAGSVSGVIEIPGVHT